MTREQALKKLQNNKSSILELEFFINKIYDDFENKSCDNCKYDFCGCDIQDSLIRSHNDDNFSDFCCNKWESK
jgi:hypothetical protein